MPLVNEGRLITDVAAGLGGLPIKSIPFVETDNHAGLEEIWCSQGGWVVMTRQAAKPGFYQRAVQYDTNSLWQHAAFIIGESLGRVTRSVYPTVLVQKPSHRWKNSPRHPENARLMLADHRTTDGRPCPKIEGVPLEPRRMEVIESQIKVAINDLESMIKDGEQVIAFTDPGWTAPQRVNMAREAYSWYCEPYDVFEIGKRIFSWFPNPLRLKVCSSLVAQILKTGDNRIVEWCRWNQIDINYIDPGQLFRFCVESLPRVVTFNCDLQVAISVG